MFAAAGQRNAKKSQPPLGGLDQIVSPRAEFPNRELTKPRGFDTNVPPPSAHPLPSAKGMPSPPTAIPNPSTFSGQKAAFMAVCEQIFDSQETTVRLQNQLKEQIRKSATLLYTLSSSGQMIEGLVRSHFRDMQTQYGEKFGTALTDLNRRLVAMENRTFGSSHSEAFNAAGALMSAIPREDGQGTLASIAEKLEAAAEKSSTRTDL